MMPIISLGRRWGHDGWWRCGARTDRVGWQTDGVCLRQTGLKTLDATRAMGMSDAVWGLKIDGEVFALALKRWGGRVEGKLASRYLRLDMT